MERILKIIVVVGIISALASPKMFNVISVAIKEYTGVDIMQYQQYIQDIPSLDNIKKQLADLMNSGKK